MTLPGEEGGSRHGGVTPLEMQKERNLLTGSPRPRGDLTELSCPDCAGILEAYSEGEEGFWELTCRVGHSFSMDSLVSMKEDQLEKALWASVETFGELALLYRTHGMRAEACGD